jgi:hypothetical protein
VRTHGNDSTCNLVAVALDSLTELIPALAEEIAGAALVVGCDFFGGRVGVEVDRPFARREV